MKQSRPMLGTTRSTCPRRQQCFSCSNTRQAPPTAARSANVVAQIMDECRDPAARKKWADQAYMTALLRSIPGSHAGLRSSLRRWLRFARGPLDLLGKEMPPPVKGLVAWAEVFNSGKSYGNCLAHMRTVCQLFGISDENLDHPAVKRARMGALKKPGPEPRPPMWIKLPLLQQIVKRGKDSGSPMQWVLAMLYATTYAFQLRLPSEALPIAKQTASERCPPFSLCTRFCSSPFVVPRHIGQKAIMYKEDGDICLKLESRKNLKKGPVIRRACWQAFLFLLLAMLQRCALPPGARRAKTLARCTSSGRSWRHGQMDANHLWQLMATWRSSGSDKHLRNLGFQMQGSIALTISAEDTLKTWRRMAAPSTTSWPQANGGASRVLLHTWIGVRSNAML